MYALLLAAQSPPADAPLSPLQPQKLRIPALTQLNLSVVDPVSSKTARVGDHFRVELSEPLIINGIVVLPTGTRGQGEVVHAAKARAAGKAGELILAARFLDHDGARVPLRSFSFSRRGKSHVGEAFAASLMLAPAGYLIAGGEVVVQPGTLGSAKTAADTNVVPRATTGSKPGGVP